MTHLDHVVGIGHATTKRWLVEEQVLGDHASAELAIDARSAAKIFLLHVAHHQRTLTGSGSVDRPGPFSTFPPIRIDAGQMTRHLERGSYGFAKLVAGAQQTLDVRDTRKKKFFLLGVRLEELEL